MVELPGGSVTCHEACTARQPRHAPLHLCLLLLSRRATGRPVVPGREVQVKSGLQRGLQVVYPAPALAGERDGPPAGGTPSREHKRIGLGEEAGVYDTGGGLPWSGREYRVAREC